MCIRHFKTVIIFIVSVFLSIIACQHVSNFNNCLSVVTTSRCNKNSKKLLLFMHLLIQCVAHDKTLIFWQSGIRT